MYDAIVIGARCAGSPTGMLLARQGHRVLVVDRDIFPSDTLSTSFFQDDASASLDNWGLYERLMATKPQLAPVTAVFGPGLFSASPPPSRYPGIAPRRTYLDKLLVDAAREAGAEVREGFSVQEIRTDESGRVTGIRGRDADGNSVVEDARVVVGADGRNSFLARNVAVQEYDVVEPTTCGYFSYFDGDKGEGGELHYNGNHAFFAFPTHDGQTCFAAEAPFAAWAEFKADPETYLFEKMKEHAPALFERADEAKRAETMYGMQGRRSFFRKPYGDGWALVGDAGFLKDPITGAGCNDAFRDAQLLSDGLHAWLGGREEFGDALSAYQRKRDAVAKPAYDQCVFMAELHDVTPDFLMRLGAMMAPAPA
jgi:2-polyprenyl-6-methoxyphenol hydroxylase-like FAD-dependent oxidoreductase